MKNYYSIIKVVQHTLLAAIICCASPLLSQITQSFSFTGSMQTFTVPACVNAVTVDVRGAQGANAADNYTSNSIGGLGGRSVGVLTVTPGQVLNIFVGGAGNTNGNGGFNGGGAGGLSGAGGSCFGGYAGGGGGASDIRVGGLALIDRVVVGAGGGGAGRDYCNGTCQPCGCGGSGGAGGGLTGLAGLAANNCGFLYPGTNINGGPGGSPTAGGAGAPGDGGGTSGSAGALGVGGAGAAGSLDVAGGGGGGGYYGGGGGGSASSGSGVGGGGGGGGSSFLGGLTGATTTQSFQTSNGIVILTYNFTGAIALANASPTAICSGNSVSLNGTSGLVSYTWNPGNILSQNTTVNPTSTTIYTLSGTNSLNCVSYAVVTVTVNTVAPIISVSQSSTTVCPSQTVLLTASGGVSHTWSGGVTNGVPFVPSSTSNYTVTASNGCGTSTAVTGVTVAPLPVISMVSPTLVCSQNPATLTVGGATNYSWMPGGMTGSNVVVSPSVATIYTVVGITSICSGASTVALAVNPNPTITASASNSNICQGISINLLAAGALSYSWQPGGQSSASISATPSVSTLYTVTGFNSFGCGHTVNQIVLVTPGPTVSLVASNTLMCSGGTATLFAGGANSYSWSTPGTGISLAISPTISSVFGVTGTSSTTGCSSTKTINITVFTRTMSVSASTAICVGNSVTLMANGAGTYTWSNNVQNAANVVSPIVSTVYTVNATTFTNNMNCTSSQSVSVTVYSLPAVAAAATRTSICKNETTTLTAIGASEYLWSNFSTNYSITLKGTSNTTYSFTVTGTDTNGCSKTASISIIVNACTGIENIQSTGNIQIFPNPSTGIFTVGFENVPTKAAIRIYNSLGVLIKTQEITSTKMLIDLQKEANGIYFVDIYQNDESIRISKIVKQ